MWENGRRLVPLFFFKKIRSGNEQPIIKQMEDKKRRIRGHISNNYNVRSNKI